MTNREWLKTAAFDAAGLAGYAILMCIIIAALGVRWAFKGWK